MENSNFIDVNENDFETKVINQSENKLVVVDFWAPWCSPCKQLAPIMEKVAKENIESFDLVKINIDNNQQLAAQLRIQSIPTVYAFKNKKIVNAFQGVVSEKDFVDFIEKSIGKKLKEDLSSFYDEVKKLITNKNYNSAKDKLLSIFSENKADETAISLYLECLLEQKEFEEIEEFLSSIDEDTKNNKQVLAVLTKINIAKKSKNSQSIELMLNKNKEDPKNMKVLIEISEYYFSSGEYDKAFPFLLENYPRDKEKVKEKLIEFFEALGNDHDATKTYRKKLSSLLFK